MYKKRISIFIRYPFLSGIPYIALALVILMILHGNKIVAFVFIGVGVLSVIYYYSEYSDLKHKQLMRMVANNQSKQSGHEKEPIKYQEASLPGYHKEYERAQEVKANEANKEPEIRPVIDTSDTTKTSIAITYGLKKYLDQNKLDGETFSDELVRLLSRQH
jgi:hypothetical protein